MVRKRRHWGAVICALLGPLLAAVLLVPFRAYFSSVGEALVMVAVVVAVAATGYRTTGMLAALSAAVWFDFFFTPPWGHLETNKLYDSQTSALLLIIGAAVSQMAARGRFQWRKAEQARLRLELLYDTSVAVGSTLDVTRTAEELARVAVPRFADFVTVDLSSALVEGREPTAGGHNRLRRVGIGGIRGDPPLYPAGTEIPAGPSLAETVDGVVTLESDLSAATAADGHCSEQRDRLLAYGMRSRITAPLRARETPLGVVVFWRAHGREPFEDEDRSFAEELSAKASLAIDNAHRYTHERAVSLALQRSVLLQRLPAQPAVEAAFCYLPADAQAGVGGDWFDVIPLSGLRVALVIGDVVGHGIPAAATMGRLRTAVRTLADVDLPPGELLTQLDDLVIRLADEEDPAGAGAGSDELGATCVYAVYDPISRSCALASAGHLYPLIISNGTAATVHGHVGPPLGIGGLPFETTELQVEEGSVLAMFTDGLVESRNRDIDQGLARLGQVLTRPEPSLDKACSAAVDAMGADGLTDDVALLLARTKALSSGQVASWEIPADPAMVVWARKLACEQLDEWGLTDALFTTELVVSELVTNAIRYGAPPITLRLIRDRVLICETSDASNTAPHLRRARTWDEGGRGLLLVAQLTQRWGTRQNSYGKTIWCEQALSDR
ncbi:SpoIIE family protein phosphatase [Peterkaempfera sp. SMS 1(5)a]|uniref:SpoIIE family protein phosphatase n=1 Tax=Peterkaempfera podocarpi TaxID=3232308 RepID=UPI00366F2B92